MTTEPTTGLPPAETRMTVGAGSLELVIRPDPVGGGFEIRLRLHERGAPLETPEPLPRNGVHAAAEPAPPVAVVPSPASAPAPEAPGDAVEVRAPLVGVFYRRPSPGEPPFVEVGSEVEAGSTLAIVEAMKMMNHIPAPVSGRVVAIAAADQDVVEYDEVLVSIAAAGDPA
jgi:acetyl-CoA carboxylase biotin carboxyl carrier protein